MTLISCFSTEKNLEDQNTTMKHICVLLLIGVVLASRGFDVSYFQGAPSISDFECLVKNGYGDFAVLQAQRSTGAYNQYVGQTYRNVKAAGIKYVDMYFFPSKHHDPVQQVHDTVAKLKADGVYSSSIQMWIDVENTALYFSTCAENVAFLHKIIDTLHASWPGRVGMYTSESQWNPIACNSKEFADMQLWWPRYDGVESLSHNWASFGGWSRPAVKQYRGSVPMCGTTIDEDFY
ncbi:Glycoside hydrolase, family 25 [Carpediemonas membranifera]|uniref:Glycoside hydrolase, family 25 n=1 Tax=Carpediemonas membranifera TaxID=201153 RepID=A0A8J6B6M0_9EUKA|nr:Glycoside hydrolase, family 25 [Carpediemonas membranifera]|eukprot:KAG9391077.1 Glycoside hydrolase, family 25 [Carpediemonas membranifera]